jgi:type III pantothenate kinase
VLLAIDIGNTNVKLATFDYPGPAADPRDVRRLPSDGRATADDVAAALEAALRQDGARPERIAHVAVASVVPALTAAYRAACARVLPRATFFVIDARVRTGLTLRYDPEQIGVDRLVNAAAAFEQVGAAAIVVDVGTATTFDYVSAAGEYRGGAIFPGPEVALDALVSRTARLGGIAWTRPPSAIGASTEQSLQSGMFYGYAGALDGVVERMRAEIDGPVRVLATGGLARLFVGVARTLSDVDPHLTLRGIRAIFARNAAA